MDEVEYPTGDESHEETSVDAWEMRDHQCRYLLETPSAKPHLPTRKKVSQTYRRVIRANAARLVGNLLRTRDLLPVDVRVVRAFEPVAEAELAAILQGRRQLVASIAAQTAVLRAPARGGSAPLLGAGVELTNTATRDGEVELAFADVVAGIRRLHDHLLAGDGGGCESEPASISATGCFPLGWLFNLLVARAAGVRLSATGGNGSETVGGVFVDDPRALVRAHVGIAALAGGCLVEIRQWRVVL